MTETTKNEVNEANDGWTEITPASATTPTTETTTTEPAAAPKKRKAKAEPPVIETPASEPAPAPKKTRKPKATESEVAPAPVEPSPAPAKKTKRAKSNATLAEVFKGYVESLESEGKSDGTIASYRMELQLAGDDLGVETPIAEITPERVLLFMTSDRVMKKRNGKSKSPLSIDKTRRVLRQALTYAETAKLVAQAPVPELAASH